MARRSGSADLPLHGGQVPRWLADRMIRLGAVMTQAVVHHYGRDELLRRLANPFWFQAFGAEKHKGTLYSFATILPCGGPTLVEACATWAKAAEDGLCPGPYEEGA